MAQTVTLLAEQVRNSIGPTPVAGRAVPNGVPRDFTVNILSSDWTTVGAGVHQLDISIERSFDGGVTWDSIAAATLQSGTVKGGGLPGFTVSWDGLAALVRINHVTTTVNGIDNVAFSWGLSISA
jgi:hypothetical protein